MKIVGIFRGFPGLGRVVSGVGLLNQLRERGHEVLGYSYMQGVEVLKDYGIPNILEKQPMDSNIMEIGLNPISKVSGELIGKILDINPDLVIIDGEALLVSTLSLVFDRNKIISLLNPTDLYNDSLPESTIAFYKMHYLAGGTAIVHTPKLDENILPRENINCNLHLINTIIRNDILKIKSQMENRNIIGILGGGCANSSENFYNSTLEIGKKIIGVAQKLNKENFIIYCNDKKIKRVLDREKENIKNIKIIDEYKNPKDIYREAKIVLCRSGRNTVSELLYLEKPGILFSSKGDFRSKEQEKNIDTVISINPFKIRKSSIDEPVDGIIEKINYLEENKNRSVEFIPGNERALEIIENILRGRG
ncbi:MAG: glycosyltransferase [Cetobacterium sp.]|uniref:glycosyltransferase n=1 Tax=Cetobacterium sp. TaxID=2071632 RepID=UPI003F2FF43A